MKIMPKLVITGLVIWIFILPTKASVIHLPDVFVEVSALGESELSSKDLGPVKISWSLSATKLHWEFKDSFKWPLLKWKKEILWGPQMAQTTPSGKLLINGRTIHRLFYHQDLVFTVSLDPSIQVPGYEKCPIPAYNHYYTVLNLSSPEEAPSEFLAQKFFGYPECSHGASVPALQLVGEKTIEKEHTLQLHCHYVGIKPKEEGDGYLLTPLKEGIDRWKADCDSLNKGPSPIQLSHLEEK